jgi:syntaxin-binding protein 5
MIANFQRSVRILILQDDMFTFCLLNIQYQHPRLLVTEHLNLTVQFHDISARLLATPDSLQIQTHFPQPLPDLTIDLKFILTDPLVSARISSTTLHQTHFALVRITSESLECALILQSGEIFVYRLSSGPHEEVLQREASDNELTILEHIPRRHDRRFYPFLLLAPDKGAVTAFSLSNIGKTLLRSVAVPPNTLLIFRLSGIRLCGWFPACC